VYFIDSVALNLHAVGRTPTHTHTMLPVAQCGAVQLQKSWFSASSDASLKCCQSVVQRCGQVEVIEIPVWARVVCFFSTLHVGRQGHTRGPNIGRADRAFEGAQYPGTPPVWPGRG